MERDRRAPRQEAELERRAAASSGTFALGEQSFRTAFERARIGMAMVDLRGNWLRVNDALCEIVGYTQQELLRTNFQSITHPDDLDADLEKVDAVVDGRYDIFQTEKRYLHKSGRVVWVELTGSVVRATDGTPLHFISQVQDVTARHHALLELRQSEERYRTIIETALEGIWIYDDNAITTYVNRHVAQMLGWTEGELIGRSIFDFVPARDRDAALALFEQRKRGERGTRDARFCHKDGRELWVIVSATPIFDGQGEFLGTTALLTDITARKEGELALEAAKRDAESATRAKSEFIANMSHEIRTPLNAVVGLTHLALQTELSEQQRDYLRKVQASASSLAAIVNDILDFSQVEAGKLTLKPCRFELADVIARTLAAIAHQAEAKRLPLTTGIAADAPPALVGDPLRLQQVLTHLLSNAVKFTHAGSVTLAVEVARRDSERVRLRFVVRDTGIGMSDLERQNLFEAFRQADSSSTRRFGGMGLGLAICKQWVEMMGGQIEVQSVLGQGSSFSFSADLGVDATPCSAACDGAARAWAAQTLRGVRVLVVEDNAINQQVAREILAGAGAAVDTASDGLAGVERAAAGTYDAVLLDLQMPGIDGLQVARLIRSQPSLAELPLIAMTAHAQPADRELCLRAGMNDHVAKPIDAQHLLGVIARWTHVTPSFDHAPAAPFASSAVAPSPPILPGINVEAALERLGGDHALLLELMADFKREFASAPEQIQQALDEQRFDAARAFVHTLKGVAANLSAESLASVAESLEHALRAAKYERAPELMAELRGALVTVLDAETPR